MGKEIPFVKEPTESVFESIGEISWVTKEPPVLTHNYFLCIFQLPFVPTQQKEFQKPELSFFFFFLQDVCQDGRERKSSKKCLLGPLCCAVPTCSVACVIPPHADVLAQTLAQCDGHCTNTPILEWRWGRGVDTNTNIDESRGRNVDINFLY